jgi:hypothetical protein
MNPNDDRIYCLLPPSTVRMVRTLNPDGPTALPLRLGRILAVPGLEQEREDEISVFFKPRARAWSEKQLPRYVTIGEDLRTVYSWPLEWLYCREFAFGRFVRRVGRIADHQLIFDGHYFLSHLGIRAEI